ncbi:MAG: penicillin acylase family protein [Chitinophagales bacterium]
MKAVLCLLVVSGLIYLFSHSLGPLPPLGKVLDPVHGFMANAETEKDLKDETESLSSPENDSNTLTQKINGNVFFDDRLVPHIFADDMYSLYFIQGYVTAKYRLWQMETQTRAAAGRLSEVLGKDLLNYDREQRRIGMGFAAENALKELQKDTRLYDLMQAYADGVNKYIETLDYASYPLEYKLIDHEPEPWTLLKTMYLLKYMSNTLSGFDDDVEFTNILNKIGRKDFDILFPDRPKGIVPIIPAEKKYDFNVVESDSSQQTIISDYYAPSNDETISNKEKNQVGSNNWVVGKEKTKNGNVILCNDPHLQLNLPSIWFEVQLNSPEVNVYGASLPGAPGVVIGFNDSIAWGVTNAGRDVRDWYAIDFSDASKKEYRYDGKLANTTQRIEVIKVRGEKDFVDTVLYTHHGPLVFNGYAGGDSTQYSKLATKENLAMRWAAHDASEEIKTFYQLNKAKNYDDYLEAISYFDCPAQNFIFGAVNGDIAITQQGKFAIKKPEAGRFVLDGSNPADDWNIFIPDEQNPTIKNPQQGYLTSANQHPTDAFYPYYYTSFDFEYFRNVVLNKELQKMDSITTEDMRSLQLNNLNLLASEILPYLLSYVHSSEEVHNSLSQWNYYNDADAFAPTYFQIWWDTLYNLLWDEFQDANLPLRSPGKYETVLAIKELPGEYIYFDDARTQENKEHLGDIVNASYTAMLQIVDSLRTKDPELLKWYQYKHTDIMHIAQIPAFSRLQIENGGYRNIVNATSEKNGPSWRMVVELSNPINAFGVYPGGQSGNPGSMYYDNFIDTWSAGGNFKLNFFARIEDARNDTKFSLTFN